MRIPLPFLALAAATAVSACSGNPDPTPPLVGAAGWSWDPATSGTQPLPVLWWGSDEPAVLPLLDPGDCAPSGSVQGLTAFLGLPVATGISVTCVGGVPSMRPVTWLDGAVSALEIPVGDTQGTGLAVATVARKSKITIPDVFVGGATGTGFPVPAIWKNGVAVLWGADLMLPPDHDSGVITSLVATDKFLVAGAIAHVTGSSPPRYTGIGYLVDIDFTAATGDYLPLPQGYAAASFTGGVSLVVVGTTVFSAAAISMDGSPGKPVIWDDDLPIPYLGLDFETAPWAVPTGLSMVELVAYTSGYVLPTTASAPPQPAIWADAILALLPTADPSAPVGAGEAVATYKDQAYVAGESCGADLVNRGRRLSVPALWTNGVRSDLGTLAAPGISPAVAEPLFGWWRLPGTPDGSPPDWPYPGGVGPVWESGSMSAAGSGVARAMVTVPPE